MNCDECGADPEAAWWAAALLHRRLHGEREPFTTCAADVCLAIKDALFPDWRVYRPPWSIVVSPPLPTRAAPPVRLLPRQESG